MAQQQNLFEWLLTNKANDNDKIQKLVVMWLVFKWLKKGR